jgi:hypothetical protein
MSKWSRPKIAIQTDISLKLCCQVLKAETINHRGSTEETPINIATTYLPN